MGTTRYASSGKEKMDQTMKVIKLTVIITFSLMGLWVVGSVTTALTWWDASKVPVPAISLASVVLGYFSGLATALFGGKAEAPAPSKAAPQPGAGA